MEYQNKNDNGAFISSTLDDYLLDPYEFRIYARIVRRAGTNGCYESVNNMAKACMMSLAKARKSLHSLREMKLITITDRSEKGLTNLCTVNSFSDWKEKRDIDSIKSEKKEDYIKKNKGLTRSEIARASKKTKDPLPDTIAPPIANMVDLPLANMVDPPSKYASTPLANMVDKGTPVKESTQGSPENIERSETSRIYPNPKDPDVIQTIDISPNSWQQQDKDGQQNVEYTSLDDDPNPNITPPSAAPPNSLAVANNYDYVEGEQVAEKLTPYLAAILDKYTRGEIEKIPDMQVKQIARVTLGNFPKKYRTEGFIMGSSNDIFADFKQYVFESCKFSTMIKAINYIKSLEKDPNKHDDLKTLVLEYELKKAGTSIKQVVSKFKSQEIANSPAVEILRKMRSL